MVSLKLQKRLAASVLNCGLRKVWLDPNEVNEISMAKRIIYNEQARRALERGIDILATNAEAKRAVTIQCKSSRDKNKSWILSDKAEHFTAKNHYYVFVKLGAETERPAYHIVPSKDVAKYVANSHRTWLKGKKPDGGQRKDTAMRVFIDAEDKYLEKWDLLGL